MIGRLGAAEVGRNRTGCRGANGARNLPFMPLNRSADFNPYPASRLGDAGPLVTKDHPTAGRRLATTSGGTTVQSRIAKLRCGLRLFVTPATVVEQLSLPGKPIGRFAPEIMARMLAEAVDRAR